MFQEQRSGQIALTDDLLKAVDRILLYIIESEGMIEMAVVEMIEMAVVEIEMAVVEMIEMCRETVIGLEADRGIERIGHVETEVGLVIEKGADPMKEDVVGLATGTWESLQGMMMLEKEVMHQGTLQVALIPFTLLEIQQKQHLKQSWIFAKS